MPDLAPGTVVAGYRIEALVGRGGMGVVYRALQLGLERRVALKVIAAELVDDPVVRERFLAEAQAAARVDHPNVIPVHDAGEADGVAYLAMRFVAGSDLRSLVRLGGPLSPGAAASIVAQAGAALDAIHRAGLVHRDVKPANLLVDEDQHVYLTDFGLAKAVLTRSGPTRTGHWVGTLDYVAPEQIRGGRVDARADVYALGGVLHHALTGHVPFDLEGDEAKLWAQLSAPPPAPSATRPELPAELDAVVARAMAKAPEERYPSAGDLGRAARAAAEGRTLAEPERTVARGAAAPGAAASEPGLAGDASTRTADTELPTRTAQVPRGGADVGVRDAGGADDGAGVRDAGEADDGAALAGRGVRDAGEADDGAGLAGRGVRDAGGRGAGAREAAVADASGARERGADGRGRAEDGGAGGRREAGAREPGADGRGRADDGGAGGRGVAGADVRAGAPGLASRLRRPWLVIVAVGVAAALAGRLVLPDRDGGPGGSATTPTATPAVTATATATPWVARAAQTVEQVGDRPTGIAYAGGDLWVASPDSPFLTRIVAKTGTERKDHPEVGRDAQAIVGDRDAVWVVVGNDRVVLRLDARTGHERDRLEVPGTPRRVAVDGSNVWVTTVSRPGEPGLILRYDRSSGRLERTITVPEGVSALAAAPDRIWIVKRDTNRLARVVGNTLEETVDAPGPVRSMAYGAGALWLVLAQEDTIARYGMSWRSPVTSAAGHSPSTALVAGGHVFVASRNDQSVLVLDPETLKPRTDPVPVPLNPVALAEADGAVWVTSLTNAITRIDYR